MTVSGYARECEVDVTPGASIPWDKMDDWRQNANAYRVTLKRAGRRMTVDFFMGSAICHEPTAKDVLGCLHSDAHVDGMTFEDFCAEFGYDEDSRKAEKTYKACKAMAQKLRRFFGREFDTFITAENDL